MFLMTFVYDVIYTLYLRRVSQGKALASAIYSSLTFFMSAVVMLSFFHNNELIIPAMLGGFIGTWLLVKLDIRKK